MGFGAPLPDNKSIAETARSSKNLETLTKALIILTAGIIVIGLPVAAQAMQQVIKNTPNAAIGILVISFCIIIFAVVIVLDPSLISLTRFREWHAKREQKKAKYRESWAYQGKQLLYQYPFALEDFRAVIGTIIIIGIFLWLSIQLKQVFPTGASSIISNLVLAMWILFIGTILVFIIMLYRAFRDR